LQGAKERRAERQRAGPKSVCFVRGSGAVCAEPAQIRGSDSSRPKFYGLALMKQNGAQYCDGSFVVLVSVQPD
jgi:hypothetical protein